MRSKPITAAWGLLGLCATAPLICAEEWQLSGHLDIQQRRFFNSGVSEVQHKNYTSVAADVELYREWKNGDSAFIINGFIRGDQHDSERSHADIRELNWLSVGDDWELRLGVNQVFWGVTESQHLIDIVNQADQVENLNNEEKLGQPMVQLSFIRDWGVVELFALTGFRERTFPGSEGRLRFSIEVDTDLTFYESSAEDKRLDFAARWSHTIDELDIGFYHFHGTAREPELVLEEGFSEPVFAPYYPVINQTGLETLWVTGDWLWKLEAIHRSINKSLITKDHTAFVAGFEYTIVGLADTEYDFGLLMEYNFDSRDKEAFTTLDNDTYLGARLVLNDMQSTAFLAGVTIDNDHWSKVYFIEGSRRFGENIKVDLELGLFNAANQDIFLSQLADEDYLELTVGWYF